MTYTEKDFELSIENHLLKNGYLHLSNSEYDKEKAFFPNAILSFIKTTQAKEYSKLEQLLGKNTDTQLLSDLNIWMNSYGSLITLRQGFKCYGRGFRLAFFKASHSMNPELEELYLKNQVSITRQLHYSSKNQNSIDIVLSINGVPIITIELKNPLTGQTVEDAIQQYRKDRDQNELIFSFKKRTLVHFAVDTDLIFMTTLLAGANTYFLPFNKGYQNGAGNPPNDSSYKTAYLWEEILQKDSFLDIAAKFIHLQTEDKINDEGKKITKQTVIFPRYHQLDAVRKLLQAAKQEGTGHSYLIEHSAGSGKSNTIGWLAHRLSSLHNNQNERTFDSVIVITDRLVLDRQLQDTIYQFEHKMGVVQKIDEDSKQLTMALLNKIPIIITTLQKFPFVLKQLSKMVKDNFISEYELPTRNCAIIIDEAHSSQSGETATEVKKTLAGKQLALKARSRAKEEGNEDIEELYKSMLKRGTIENLSFFAFTATPKHKTLKIFGRSGEPFHQYTMKQAIEEGFIMDVLKNYTTYKVYYKLIQKALVDKNVKRKEAAKALARFMKLHPYNIAQKTEIMVEHFNSVTRHKIAEKAKAMVVTGSRLEAIRYKQAFDEYIQEKKYNIKTLVAFSGKVEDDKVEDVIYTEVKMNKGIKETELPEKFASPEYQVLLVAEKYQTGFDQPLLHTMYVDKKLGGIQAVQTLSRLNRIHPLKEDTFILDFVNEREDIQEAFKQFFEGAEFGEEAEPERLYQLDSELKSAGIYSETEVSNFAKVFFKPRAKQSPKDHQDMNSILDVAISKFEKLIKEEPDTAEVFRKKLISFNKLYSFLSQVIPYQDSDLEKTFTYLKFLYSKLPKYNSSVVYNFDTDIQLQYYRIQKISEGSINLNEGKTKPLDGPKDVGSGQEDEEQIKLSKLIDVLNEKFSTDFTEADQLFFDQIITMAVANTKLQEAAKINPIEKFSLIFSEILEELFIGRMELNEDIFEQYINNDNFQNIISKYITENVYQSIRNQKKEMV